MPSVNVPGVGQLNFPDGMSQADMSAAIEKNFPTQMAAVRNKAQVQGWVKDAKTPTSFEAAAIPVGAALSDTGRSIKHLANLGLAGPSGTLAATVQNNADQANTDAQEQPARDAAFDANPRTYAGLYAPASVLSMAPLGEGVGGLADEAVAQGAPNLARLAAGVAGPQLPKASLLARAAAVTARSGTRGAIYGGQTPGDTATNVAGGALLGSAADAIPAGLSMLRGAPGEIGEAVTKARQAGYSLPPSEAAAQGAPAPIGKAIEGLTGSAKLRTSAAMKAQDVTDSLAAQDIGVAPGTPLTDAVLDKAREPWNQVYKEVGALSDDHGPIPTDTPYTTALSKIASDNSSSFGGNPDIQSLVEKYSQPSFTSSDAVDAIKSLRKNATSNYKASNAFQVKNAYELGDLADAQKSVADALEQRIDRFAKSAGSDDLVQRWQDARKQLAKINSVDSAIKEGTTNVSAPSLARSLNRGAPLSGNLRTVAQTANAFPRVLTEPSKLGNKVPINMLEGGIGGLGGLTAYLAGSPAIAAASAAGMVARPLARSALLSSGYQDRLAQQAPSLIDLLKTGAGKIPLPVRTGIKTVADPKAALIRYLLQASPQQ